jgi:hypothetical protein
MFNRLRVLSRTSLLLGATTYIVYPQVKTETDFHYMQNEFNNKLVNKCKVLRNYRPSFLYSWMWPQTLIQVFVNKDGQIPIEYTRHILKMKDGGSTSIDWATPEQNNI